MALASIQSYSTVVIQYAELCQIALLYQQLSEVIRSQSTNRDYERDHNCIQHFVIHAAVLFLLVFIFSRTHGEKGIVMKAFTLVFLRK